MAILITGGSGFIGLKLSELLLKKGHQIVLFDIAPPEKGAEGATFVKGNISDWAEVLNVVRDRNIEHIFHLAAMLSAQCEANPWAAIQVNGLGIYHLLEASRLFGVRKVIFTNADARHARRVLSRLGILRHFESIIDIHMLEFVNKPDRRAYLKALDFASVQAEECVLIEDSARNLAPAGRLGMTTVLVGEGTRTDGAHYHIARITDLENLLMKMGTD